MIRADAAVGNGGRTQCRSDRAVELGARSGVLRGHSSETGREQLEARKQVVEAGLVQVRTEVQSTQQHLQVTASREEVFVEREAVAGYPAPRPLGAAGVLVE